MNAKKLSFASREEAELLTEQTYGGISPLGLPENIKIYIDKNVMSREKVFIGGGNRVTKFFLSPEALVTLNLSLSLLIHLMRPNKKCCAVAT